jgi:hypothetical protein
LRPILRSAQKVFGKSILKNVVKNLPNRFKCFTKAFQAKDAEPLQSIVKLLPKVASENSGKRYQTRYASVYP